MKFSSQPWFWFCLLCLLALPALAGSARTSVAYQLRQVGKTRAHVITVNLNDRQLLVKPVLAHNTVGRGQSFLGFMAQHQPLAQITGSYFSMRTYHPIGDVVIDGKLRFRGHVGTALAIKPDNTASMVNIPQGWIYSWPGYDQVLRGGMRVLQNGRYAVYPKNQGFKDPSLFRPASRTAVGLTAHNKLLLVGISKPILLSELATVMKGLGCVDAMTLDGGTSTGLAYGTSVIIPPGRLLSNVLIVTERPAPPPDTAPITPASPDAPVETAKARK